MAVIEKTSTIGIQKSRAYAKSKRRAMVRTTIVKSVTYLGLSLLAFAMLIPLLWMVSTALKDPAAVFDFPPTWLPKPIFWNNFRAAWHAMPFGRFYLNSMYVGTMVTLGQVLTSAMAAYAFARLKFPGRDKIFLAYLATMMIPGSVTMIPLFILMKLTGLVDTYTALILPGCFSAFGTFMLRQFFMALPRELEEAAKLDGCSHSGIFWKIILPLSKPALATLVTITFQGSWGNFMWPLIVTNSPEMRTLPVGLQSFQGQYHTDWTLLMSGSLIALVPVIAVFLANQKYFIEGIQLGAIKG